MGIYDEWKQQHDYDRLDRQKHNLPNGTRVRAITEIWDEYQALLRTGRRQLRRLRRPALVLGRRDAHRHTVFRSVLESVGLERTARDG